MKKGEVWKVCSAKHNFLNLQLGVVLKFSEKENNLHNNTPNKKPAPTKPKSKAKPKRNKKLTVDRSQPNPIQSK